MREQRRPLMATRRVAGMALALALGAGLSACAKDAGQGEGTVQGESTTCEYRVGGNPARPVDPPSANAPTTGEAQVTMRMAAGTVTLSLDRSHAPCAVNSMESLVRQKFYDGTRCHRLVDQGIFILQCGDPTGSGAGGPGYSYDDELTGTENYPRGTVAMANPGKDANGSQFFIVWADSPLEPHYTVIGKVDEKSLKVIQSIASQGVDGTDPNQSTPIADASITTMALG
ncbi:peptidylprolyl isomerase [Aestuariimicrobium sp. p3-SID1156]|uniref:peptidylprolyl isomerase n=1 Tax=Aestuariimicrobium sp. p3-SID1156 TaxID=2916038 RepID=UPI00223BA633|nr:peptidylprolyl isomerase [Aestuariimicrobium sp. p3-SID1156]MCT1459451.1 peptidylprolyl isomerase [Aestuariimicrobium sp. p3-SID1156]